MINNISNNEKKLFTVLVIFRSNYFEIKISKSDEKNQ